MNEMYRNNNESLDFGAQGSKIKTFLALSFINFHCSYIIVLLGMKEN